MRHRTLAAELPDLALFEAGSRYGDLGVHAVVDLHRRFSRAALEHAFEGAIEAFPVLGCRYEPGIFRDRWRVIDTGVGDAVHIGDASRDLDEQTAVWTRRPIDVTRDRPLRIVSLPRGEGSRLIISLSHVAVDGGGMGAVGHVIGARLYGIRPTLPIDPRRSVASALAGLRLVHLPILVRDGLRVWGTELGLLRTEKRERPFPADGTGEAHWGHLRIDAAELGRLKTLCKGQGASVNDALIAALARVATGRSRRGAVAVMYTMDLRRYAGAARLKAANLSSVLPVVLPRRAVGDLATTARAVAAVTSHHRSGLTGPGWLVAALSLGLGAPHALGRRVVRALAPLIVDPPLDRALLVTNVGPLDEGLAPFGDDIERLHIVGPNVRGVSIPVVVAFGFRGELHLELFAGPNLAPSAIEELETELRAALELR